MSTPQYDLYPMSVGFLYLALGKAGVEFPTTTRSHPSWSVMVQLNANSTLIESSHRVLFPMQIPWDLWKNVFVPLLSERDSGVFRDCHLSYMSASLLRRDASKLLSQVESYIRDRLESLGFLPPDSEGPPIQSTIETGIVGPEDTGSWWTRVLISTRR
jgi:hypothetical protein